MGKKWVGISRAGMQRKLNWASEKKVNVLGSLDEKTCLRRTKIYRAKFIFTDERSLRKFLLILIPLELL